MLSGKQGREALMRCKASSVKPNSYTAGLTKADLTLNFKLMYARRSTLLWLSASIVPGFSSETAGLTALSLQSSDQLYTAEPYYRAGKPCRTGRLSLVDAVTSLYSASDGSKHESSPNAACCSNNT